MPGSTPIYGLRYQQTSDSPNGASLGQNLAQDVEDELVRIDSIIPGIRTFAYATSSSSAFGTTEAAVLTISGFTFKANRAYRIEFAGGWHAASGTPTRVNARIRKTNSTGTLWIDFGWSLLVSGTPITGDYRWGYVRRNAGTDLTTDFVLSCNCDTGTVDQFANSTLRRWVLIEEIGAAADYAGIAFDVT